MNPEQAEEIRVGTEEINRLLALLSMAEWDKNFDILEAEVVE